MTSIFIVAILSAGVGTVAMILASIAAKRILGKDEQPKDKQ